MTLMLYLPCFFIYLERGECVVCASAACISVVSLWYAVCFVWPTYIGECLLVLLVQ